MNQLNQNNIPQEVDYHYIRRAFKTKLNRRSS